MQWRHRACVAQKLDRKGCKAQRWAKQPTQISCEKLNDGKTQLWEIWYIHKVLGMIFIIAFIVLRFNTTLVDLQHFKKRSNKENSFGCAKYIWTCLIFKLNDLLWIVDCCCVVKANGYEWQLRRNPFPWFSFFFCASNIHEFKWKSCRLYCCR